MSALSQSCPRRRNNAVTSPNFSAIALMGFLWIAGLTALPPYPSHTLC